MGSLRTDRTTSWDDSDLPFGRRSMASARNLSCTSRHQSKKYESMSRTQTTLLCLRSWRHISRVAPKIVAEEWRERLLFWLVLQWIMYQGQPCRRLIGRPMGSQRKKTHLVALADRSRLHFPPQFAYSALIDSRDRPRTGEVNRWRQFFVGSFVFLGFCRRYNCPLRGLGGLFGRFALTRRWLAEVRAAKCSDWTTVANAGPRLTGEPHGTAGRKKTPS